MWITYSDDLIHWDEPKLLAKAEKMPPAFVLSQDQTLH